ncbi:predicted protein [Botrytis cinerea T4]|uniref:Uncharacterized protein n=1 Tax=Botryotinia fuckeliana (strain T4) TaxID=999810 RepID=G2XVL3_BOTF4|nr:predicted protein [Botrytis cinerea T4]
MYQYHQFISDTRAANQEPHVVKQEFGFTQNDSVNADRSTLAIFPNQPVTDDVSAEQPAANEAEQAPLFGESRERTGLGGVSGGESGENVDADGDVAMG